MSEWSPDQYERFRDERSQPFFDLAALVEARPGMQVVDLGCGTGELTAVLHERLRAATTLGLDSSPSMLARSAAHVAAGLTFELGDIASFAAASPFDLVFSNAALQWLPDHPALFARIAGLVGPRGQLAVQMPANHDHPSHTLAHELARESPFREALAGYRRETPMLPPETYASLLYALGFVRQHVRLQVYGHVLAGSEEVIEWVKGTLLVDYERRMPADVYRLFLERYRERLLPVLGASRPYFYPFKRILLRAERA